MVSALLRVVMKVRVSAWQHYCVCIMLAVTLTDHSAFTVNVAYNSFYADTDYPITKILRDPVYVEVQLLEKTDPNLVLTLSHCWTTTSSTPHSLPQWDILING